MFRKKKFLIGGIVLLLAIGYLGYTGFVSSATYYYKVGEFLDQAGSLGASTVRVDGDIAVSSVQKQGTTLQFTMVEGTKSLPVIYHGTVPDSFKEGNEVVVEGRLNSSGVFEAKSILTKCASKYVPGQ